jgi:hypothetical protein
VALRRRAASPSFISHSPAELRGDISRARELLGTSRVRTASVCASGAVLLQNRGLSREPVLEGGNRSGLPPLSLMQVPSYASGVAGRQFRHSDDRAPRPQDEASWGRFLLDLRLTALDCTAPAPYPGPFFAGQDYWRRQAIQFLHLGNARGRDARCVLREFPPPGPQVSQASIPRGAPL